jgi:hypothetical protein
MSNHVLNLPRRTSRDELAPEARFRIDAVFIDEMSRVKEWLAQRANDSLGDLGLEPDLVAHRVVAAAPAIAREVSLVFGNRDVEQSVNPALRKAASDGTLAMYVPARSVIWGWRALVVLCAFGEVAVGAAQVLLSDAGPAMILQASLLAASALLAGWGLGGLMVRTLAQTLPPLWRVVPPDPGGRRGEIFKLVAGSLAALGLCWMRSVGIDGDEKAVVIVLTVVLAAMLIVSEAFHMYYRAKFDWLWQRMFDAQVWEADERHRRAGQFYEEHYIAQVQSLLERRGIRGSSAVQRNQAAE